MLFILIQKLMVTDLKKKNILFLKNLINFFNFYYYNLFGNKGQNIYHAIYKKINNNYIRRQCLALM